MEAPLLLSQWEADLNRLLRLWPLTAPLEQLMPLLDQAAEERFPDTAHGEAYAQRLTLAMAFLWHRMKDSAISDFVISGSSGTVIKPALASALFRIIMALPPARLLEPLNSDQVLRLMAEDRRQPMP